MTGFAPHGGRSRLLACLVLPLALVACSENTASEPAEVAEAAAEGVPGAAAEASAEARRAAISQADARDMMDETPSEFTDGDAAGAGSLMQAPPGPLIEDGAMPLVGN
ncbi:hypothetical protein [Tropicimonas sp.]|uniref:hypothetical protein n=1 Tax=Tropicimonas sp. TaxID=2067044 RepID=UPI003A87DF0C